MKRAARLFVCSCPTLVGALLLGALSPVVYAQAAPGAAGAATEDLEDTGLSEGGEDLSEAPQGWSPVVGGSQSPAGRWPDTAAVVMGSQVSCTGTLIAPDVVITAGHCIGGVTAVILDTNNYSSGGERIRVKSEHEYPSSWLTEDVGVLILEEASEVEPRTIAMDCVLDELYDGAPVNIVGYGATDIWGTQYGSKLMEAASTVNDHDCSDLWSGCNAAVSPGGELSAGGDGVDACYGDSGGPLYLETSWGDFLVGVTSRSYANVWAPCEEGGIYGRPDAVVDWIESTTGRSLARPVCDDGGSGGGSDGGGSGGSGGGGSSGSGGSSGDDANHSPDPWAPSILVVQGRTGRTKIDPDDPDADDTHTFTLESAPQHGEVALSPDGLVQYEAPTDWAGTDVVEVLVMDREGEAAIAAIRVQVEPRQEAESRGCAHARHRLSSALLLLAALGLVTRSRRWERGDPPPQPPQR